MTAAFPSVTATVNCSRVIAGPSAGRDGAGSGRDTIAAWSPSSDCFNPSSVPESVAWKVLNSSAGTNVGAGAGVDAGVTGSVIVLGSFGESP